MRSFFYFRAIILLTCISFHFIHQIFMKFLFIHFFSYSVFFYNLTAKAMFTFFLINFNFFDWLDFRRLWLIFLVCNFWVLWSCHNCNSRFCKITIKTIFFWRYWWTNWIHLHELNHFIASFIEFLIFIYSPKHVLHLQMFADEFYETMMMKILNCICEMMLCVQNYWKCIFWIF